MAQYFEPLIMAAVGAASKTPNHQQQMNLLDQTKTLAESALQMLYTAKEAGGNPKVSRRGTCRWRTLLCMWVLHGAHVCPTWRPQGQCVASLSGGELPPAFPHSGFSLQQAAHTQEALEEAVQMMKEAVEDLTTTLNEAASAAGVVGGMVDSITQAINQVRGAQRGPGQGWVWERGTVRVIPYKLKTLWARAGAGIS